MFAVNISGKKVDPEYLKILNDFLDEDEEPSLEPKEKHVVTQGIKEISSVSSKK